jgi:DHA1 family multidrug resistance protein B-like MFS transporter
MISGYIADRIGRKKVMSWAQGIQVVAFLGMAFANSIYLESVLLTALMFILINVSTGFINPAAEALVIDVTTTENRPIVYSFMYWSGNIAISIGVIINMILIVWRIHDTFIVQREEQKKGDVRAVWGVQFWKNYWNVIKDGPFMLFCLGTILIFSLEFQLDKYIAVRMQQDISLMLFIFEVDGLRMLSIIIMINTLFVVCFTLYVMKWVKPLNQDLVLYGSLFIYTVGYSILAFTVSPLLILIATVLFTIGELVSNPIRQTYLASLVNEKARSSYMAVSSLTYNIAMLFGGVGLMIGEFLSPTTMGGVFFIMGLLGIVSFYFVIQHLKSKAASGDMTAPQSTQHESEA